MKRFVGWQALLTTGLVVFSGLAGAAVWDGGGGDNNWSTGPNWDNDVAPQNNGTANVTLSGNTRTTPVVDTPWNVQSLAFSNATAPFVLSGSAVTLQGGGLYNGNATAGRDVIVSNNVVLAAAQTCTVTSANGITTLAGNLSGSGNVQLALPVTRGAAPALRLSGTNAGYTGSINLYQNGVNGQQLMLMQPSAMIGGTILRSTGGTGSGDLVLNGAGVSAPYTFGVGTGAGMVNCGNGSRNLIVPYGGDVTWDPAGAGANYNWPNDDNQMNFCRYIAGDLSYLYLGAAGKTLTFAGADKTIGPDQSGTLFAITRLVYALRDDGTARTLNKTGAGVLEMRNAAASGNGGTTISAGGLCLTDANQIFGGNVSLKGGVLVFSNAATWGAFAGRFTSYGTGAGQWQFANGGGGFAARGAALAIDTTGTTATDFDHSFTLGSYITDYSGALYADSPVQITRDITLSATTDRTWSFAGANQEVGAVNGSWLVAGPVHEISGRIGGGAASRTLIWNGCGTETGSGVGKWGGTVRISNSANDYTATNAIMAYNGSAGNLAVIVTDDHCLGNPANPVIFQNSGSGPDSLVLFEDQGGSGKSFGRAIAIREGDASQGHSGIGSYAGAVTYTGTFTRADNSGVGAQVVYAQAGSQFTLGAPDQAATFAMNWINKAAGKIRKEGMGSVVLSNLAYFGDASCTQVWSLIDGTLATTLDPASTANAYGGQLRSVAAASWGDIAGQPDQTNTRVWAVRNVSQTYTNMVPGAWSGQFAIDVATGLTLRTYTAGRLSPQEGSAVNDMPAWDMVKTGAGAWLFWNGNTKLSASGRNNTVRVDQGIFDVTGDMGRGGLTVNGGTVLSGTFSPFTSDGLGTQRLRINAGGGKIGISPAATGNVTRTSSVTSWDQSQPSTVRLAARDNYNLGFSSGTAFPDVAAPTTLLINRDGSGTGLVYIANKALNVAGTLGGNGTLQLNNSTGLVTIASGGCVAPGDNGTGTLTIQGGLAMQAGSSVAFDLGAASDQLVVNGPLTLNGTLNVTHGAGFGAGTYTLMNSTTNIAGSGPALAPIGAGYTGAVTVDNTSTPKQVQLKIIASGTALLIY